MPANLPCRLFPGMRTTTSRMPPERCSAPGTPRLIAPWATIIIVSIRILQFFDRTRQAMNQYAARHADPCP